MVGVSLAYWIIIEHYHLPMVLFILVCVSLAVLIFFVDVHTIRLYPVESDRSDGE